MFNKKQYKTEALQEYYNNGYGKNIKKDPSPDTCGTQMRKEGCYVPILTHCLKHPLHRSKEEHSR